MVTRAPSATKAISRPSVARELEDRGVVGGIGGQQVERLCYEAHRRRVTPEAAGGDLGDLLGHPREVGLGRGKDRGGVGLGVEGQRELAREALCAYPRVAERAVPLRGRQAVLQPVPVGLEGLEGSRSYRVDLVATRRRARQQLVDLLGEELVRARELAERRLEMHLRHQRKARPAGGQRVGDGTEAAGDRVQSFARWSVLAGGEHVDRPTGIRRHRVPCVLAQLIELIGDELEIGSYELHVHAVLGAEKIRVEVRKGFELTTDGRPPGFESGRALIG